MPITPAARRAPGARTQAREIDRQIAALALPSLGTLLVQPLLLIVDSAMVGHLGTAPLAALALASTIVSTITGLCVFLSYATTSTASRLVGAGKHKQAISAGLDGMWLGALLGALLFGSLLLGASPVVSWFSPSPDVAAGAITYLRLTSPGLVGMLLALAATGALRGMLDARTPLWVATAGAVINVPLNYLFIYVLDLGVGGAGLGTAATELLMAAALTLAVARTARSHQVSLLPKFGGVLASAKDGWPLFVRTLSMRAAMLAAVWGATLAGEVTLAGYQVVNSVWNLAAFGLDALAIAAQALTGKAIGSGDTALLRTTLRRSTQWATRSGALVGVTMLALSPWLPLIFGAHPAPSPSQGQWWAALFVAESVHASATWALALAGLLFPLASYVFILDGVLIGAGDGRYLANAGLVILSIHLPALAGLTWLSRQAGEPWALSLLTLGFAGVFMAGRAVANGRRAATEDWH